MESKTLALTAAVCVCLFSGGVGLASGAAHGGHERTAQAPLVATLPAQHTLEGATVVLEKMTERAAEPRPRDPSEGESRPAVQDSSFAFA